MLKRWLLAAAALVCLPSFAFAQAAESAIPDFGASPTKTASTGNWATAGTWTPSGVPGAGDVVVIPNGVTVTYNQSSSAILESVTVRSGGALTFATNATTKLTVETLMVDMGGSLTIGTSGSPLSSAFTASIAFDCNSTCGNSTTDPEQFGVGFIGMGTIRMSGAVKTPYVRLTAEPAAAGATLSLASIPTGWASSDEIVLPDTTNRGNNDRPIDNSGIGYVHHNERRTLSGAVSTTSLTVTAAWTYDHPAARNSAGVIQLYPHVANITRNIRIYSQSPGTMRAHTMFHHMADVDVRYVEFDTLGRTTGFDLDCTRNTTGAQQHVADCITGTGAKTHDGTNQKGRYAVHWHKVEGPTNAGNTGYQGTFIGNSIVDALKWPLTIHDTSYLLVQNNVIWNGVDAGIMFEEGNEHFNLIDGNLIFAQHADTFDDATGATRAGCATTCSDPREHGGREASGIWGRGFHNYITNNIVAGLYNDHQQVASSVGYKFENGLTLANAGGVDSTGISITVKVPAFRGADISNALEYSTAYMNEFAFLSFEGNEAYGIQTCWTAWFHHSDGANYKGSETTTLHNFYCWNFWEEALFLYPIEHYIIDGLYAYGVYNDTARRNATGLTSNDYQIHNFTLKNFDIENVSMGYSTEGRTITGDVLMQDGTIKADWGVARVPFIGTNALSVAENRLSWIFRNVNWAGITGTPSIIGVYNSSCALPGTDKFLVFWFKAPGTRVGQVEDGFCYTSTAGDFPDLPTTYLIQNLNGDGQQFEAYFNEQVTYNVNGGLAPCSDTVSYPSIYGVACNIRAYNPAASRRPGARFRLRRGL